MSLYKIAIKNQFNSRAMNAYSMYAIFFLLFFTITSSFHMIFHYFTSQHNIIELLKRPKFPPRPLNA